MDKPNIEPRSRLFWFLFYYFIAFLFLMICIIFLFLFVYEILYVPFSFHFIFESTEYYTYGTFFFLPLVFCPFFRIAF